MEISKVNYAEIAGKFNLTDTSFDTYDVNKDGKITEEDMTAATDDSVKTTIKRLLNAADEESSVEKGGTEKEGTPIEKDAITEENAEKAAEDIIDSVKKGVNDPKNAKTLNQLQNMGLTLTKEIEACATISKILEAKIKTQDEELKKIEKEKEEKAQEYANKEKDVESKSEELSIAVRETLAAASALSEERQQSADAIIKKCVKDYANGEYPNQSLQAVIETNLFNNAFSTSILKNRIAENEFLGAEINNLCAEIDTLVGDIKSISEKYNAKNAERNNTNSLLNGITDAATKANQQYQSGYERRETMRQEIINQYKVQGVTAGDKATDNNPQVQKLGEFLDNKELDNMPFADAWAILTQTFDQCGLKFNENTGAISIPYGHNAGAKNIYNALKDALTRNYKNIVSQYEDQEEGFEDDEQPAAGGVTNINRTDPISFTNGDIRYDFISDKNKNGVLDNASEFVGAKNGWKEMEAFDKNGDGILSGDELKDITLAATNQTNGQFNFVSAEEAGIESINLNSFKMLNQKEVNKDITVGTFQINMTDGQTIEGKQTEDTNRNIANTYSTMFGTKIEDRTGAYDDNPFMEEFAETTDTAQAISKAEETISSAQTEADSIIQEGEMQVNRKAEDGTIEGERAKSEADKKAEKAEKAAKKKEEAKAEEEKAEEKKAEEKKTAEKKAAAKKAGAKKK
ncbi:MAG: hypothetical protein K6A44_06480 [bacterium]|nr:hypothetical protein [bacterium]